MRTKSKPNTGKPGISTANAYRASVKSAATDLEALVDAYGAEHIARMAFILAEDIREFGDSIHNASYNIELNSLPTPRIRKLNQSRAALKAKRETSTPRTQRKAA